jgi:signal transduction histidine kinase
VAQKEESFPGVKSFMAEPSGHMSQPSRFPREPLVAAAIVIVAVTIAVGGIVFKTRESIQREKIEFLADANQKQVAPLRRVIQLRLAQDKARLVQFAATRSVLGPGRARAFGDFALVSLLTPTVGGQWGLSWIEKGPLYPQLQSSQAMLTSDQEVALLKSLPYDRIREGDIHWQRLSDSSGRPIWALAVSVETLNSANGAARPTAAPLPEGIDYQSVQVGTGGRAVVVGFFGRNPLLSATEDFIGSSSAAFVIDSRGYAATHSNKTMVGSLLKDDPSVKEVFTARSSAGTTFYAGPQGGKMFSAFEQVDRANLYVVMSTPESISASSGQSFSRTALTTGAMAMVVGLFLVFAWGARLVPRAAVRPRRPTSEVENGRANAARSGGGSHHGPVALELPAQYLQNDDELGAVRVDKPTADFAMNQANVAADRTAFIGRFVVGLERSMKEPLLAAMAHVQLVKSKAQDGPSAETLIEISEHIAAVDRDVRRAKEMIDALSELSANSVAPSQDERVDLNRIVSSVVDTHQAIFEKEGISLRPHTVSVPLIRGREEPIRKVLGELIKNSQRALQGRTSKKISVKLDDAGDHVRLTINDNGVGMDRETKAQAFDPFFHNFTEPEARGLGLAAVRSIVQAHGATCEITSAPGDGTTVTLLWPVLSGEREAFAKRPVKIEMFEDDAGLSNALGGKVPLSAESVEALPPAPRFGLDDEDDEAWSFDTGKSALGDLFEVEETIISEPTHVIGRDVPESLVSKSESIGIRPIRRG